MKRNSLYLYLTILCFVGIILIFVFDGYVGIYDSLVVDNGRFPQTVSYDQWAAERFDYTRLASVERGEQLKFTYTVENHQFSSYQADVTVAYRHNDEAIAAPLTQPLSAPAFGKGEVAWVMPADAFVPADYPQEQSYNVQVVISRGALQREINVNISGLPAKVIPPVPAQ